MKPPPRIGLRSSLRPLRADWQEYRAAGRRYPVVRTAVCRVLGNIGVEACPIDVADWTDVVLSRAGSEAGRRGMRRERGRVDCGTAR